MRGVRIGRGKEVELRVRFKIFYELERKSLGRGFEDRRFSGSRGFNNILLIIIM